MPGLSLTEGTRIGRYRLNDRLSSASSTGGEVWRVAVDDAPKLSDCVLKVLDSSIDFGRAHAEIAALRMLRLPGIPRLLDEGTFKNRPYLVTRFISGGPFPGLGEPTAWKIVKPLARQVLTLLRGLHREGFVHCDLKPNNVRVDCQSKVWLLDFGLVTSRRPGRARPGTAGFSAPEQRRGHHVGAASDLFAFGKMLSSALIGRVLGRRHTARVLSEMPHLPVHLPAVINRLLQFDPAQRPRSADETWRLLQGDVARTKWAVAALPANIDTADALRPLFGGPEMLFHQPSDAATELFELTGGRREYIIEELDTWVCSGVALPAAGRVLVDRDGLSQIRTGMPLGRIDMSSVDPQSLDGRLLSAATLAWPSSDRTTLDVLMAEPIGAALEALVQRSLMIRLPDGRYRPRGVVAWASTEDKRAMHAALVAHLPPDAPRSVYHLFRADEAARACDLAVVHAKRMLAAGQASAAWNQLDDIVLFARRAVDDTAWRQVVIQRAQAAFYLQDNRLLSRVLTSMDDRPVLDVAALVRAQLSPKLNLAIPPFPGCPGLEMWRRFVLKRQQRLPVLGDIVEHAILRAQRQFFAAKMLYEGCRWSEAGDRFQTASDSLPGMLRRAALLDAGSAYLEAHRLDEADRCAAAVLPDATDVRHAYHEGRARWLQRAVLLRRGASIKPCPEWIAAVRGFGFVGLTTLALTTEAAVAWHANDRALCTQLALQAADAWDERGRKWPGLLCRALAAAAAGEPVDPDDRPPLPELLALNVPGVALQFLALMVAAGADPRPFWIHVPALVPSGDHSLRFAVLSVDECLQLLHVPTLN